MGDSFCIIVDPFRIAGALFSTFLLFIVIGYSLAKALWGKNANH